MTKRDLFVVVPDLDTETVMRVLLGRRKQSLKIDLAFDPKNDLYREADRDAGCYKNAVEILRGVSAKYNHAILCFDLHGCGRDSELPSEIESELEAQLSRNGWQDGECAVCVVAPELESWVWSSSSNVPKIIGWKTETYEQMKEYLSSKITWDSSTNKPSDPKQALKLACRLKQTRPTAALFEKLATAVSLDNCQDRAFQKLKSTLQRWFPATRPNS